VKIDLHVHIKKTSRCAKMDARDAIGAAINAKIDGLALLDHHYHVTPDDFAAAIAEFSSEKYEGAKVPRIFRAAELTVVNRDNGGRDDLVLIGDEPFGFPIPRPMDVSELAAVREYLDRHGGFCFWAHPFRKRQTYAFDLTKFIPDGVEVASPHTDMLQRARIMQLIHKHGMAPLSTSDSHKTRSIGKYYIDLDEDAENAKELALRIKSRMYTLFETRVCRVEGIPRGNVV
jgi:predicted metal-dependent phosphoesterase TrpH